MSHSQSERPSARNQPLKVVGLMILLCLIGAWIYRQATGPRVRGDANVLSPELHDANSSGPTAAEDWFHVGEYLPLDHFYADMEPLDAILFTKDEETRVYRIETGESGDCMASWRYVLRLPPGNYRFSVQLRGEGIKARKDEKDASGAMIRIDGGEVSPGLVGSFDWQEVTYDFNVEAETYEGVQMISELRSSSGWSEMHSPILTRLPD